MAKHKKQPSDPHAASIAALEFALECEVAALRDKEHVGALSKDLNTVAIAKLSAELRQRERHVYRALEQMTPEERLGALLSAISELAVGDRARVRALIDELDGGTGVLGS